MGLGFVLSFGYWCTDFLVVQRAMAADSMSAARRTPLIAAVPKMLFPFLVILPGMIAIALTYQAGEGGFALPQKADGTFDYDMAIPMMLGHYFPPGMLGLGLTALMASFMSGMAGNVTAFNTVWTYDIYQSYMKQGRADAHYLWVGRADDGRRHRAERGHRLSGDAVQQHHGLPPAGVRVRERAAVRDLPAGHVLEARHRATARSSGWSLGHGGGRDSPRADAAGRRRGRHQGRLARRRCTTYPSEMAQNFWTAIYAWTTCFVVTIVVSLATRRLKSDDELAGLVYRLTPRPRPNAGPWWRRPSALGAVVLALVIVLNIVFW